MPVAIGVLVLWAGGCTSRPAGGGRHDRTSPLVVEVYAVADGYVTGTPLITDGQVLQVMARPDGQGTYSLWVLLGGEGQRRLALATRAMAGQRLAVRFGDEYLATRPLRGPNRDGLIEVAARMPRARALAIAKRWEIHHPQPLDYR